ncbi:MAG: (d)CMP kinase [Chitinophagaceae bacterium]|nr:MAG: (d)CMP kinase [Chitinophagaceae bacterium]
MHKKITIAVDGYSSCGKSTLAKELARELEYVYIDSGAMYRAITYFFLHEKVNFNNKEELQKALKKVKIELKFDKETGIQQTILNGKNIENEIRSMEISDNVSIVSTLPEVRSFLVEIQQSLRNETGIVMDGRDIGTVVFPDAELKIFMTANLEVRTERRLKELLEKNIQVTEEAVQKNLEERDRIDINRETSPLRMAEDAKELDSSFLNKNQQLSIALNWARETIAEFAE